MSLSQKDILILKEIITNKFYHIDELSNIFKTTTRNMRYSINNLNYYLNQFCFSGLDIKNGKILTKLSINDYYNILSFLDFSNYTLSSNERKNYILIKFLFSDDTKLISLANDLKISKTTIKKDIIALNNELKKFELYFSYENNSIQLSGKEKKLRHLKFLKLQEYISFKNKKIIYLKNHTFLNKKENNIISNYVNKINFYQLEFLINRLEIELSANFIEDFKTLMLLYFIPTIERVEKGYFILTKNNENFLRSLKEYVIIKEILKNIISPELDYEILHLTEYFLSGYYSEKHSENIVNIQLFIELFFKNLAKNIDISFTDYSILNKKILKYLLPAIYRIKNNIELLNKSDYSIENMELFSKIKNSIEENNYLLLEPLREEEIYSIYKIIYRELEENIEKYPVSLLINIIKKYKIFSLDEELALKKEILTAFSNTFKDF